MFPTRSDTNQAVESQKMARGLKIQIYIEEGSYLAIYVAKTKVLISFTITSKLICAFVFAYAKCWLSHDVAHFSIHLLLFICERKLNA